jgi:hypothetical protein
MTSSRRFPPHPPRRQSTRKRGVHARLAKVGGKRRDVMGPQSVVRRIVCARYRLRGDWKSQLLK